MKKTIITLLFLSAAVFAAPVSFEKASQVAENAAKSKKLNLKHKSLKKQAAKAANAPAVAAKTAVAEDALLYVFQNNEDKGFVIVAGDDVFPPIIGISDKGTYDPANLPPNFAWYIENIEREMEFALENGQTQTQDIKDEWVLYAAGGIYVMGESLIQTKWNQRSPYYDKTPTIGGQQTLTGCVATAMAQIMNYHQYPASTTGTIPAYTSRDGLSVPALPPVNFEWNDMANTYPGTIAQNDAVATLMSAAGRSVEMNYGTSESGAYSKDVPIALITYFDYDYRVQSINRDDNPALDWVGLLKNQIESGLPVYYSGTGENDGGHAFVLDGYDASNNFHINWGWGGNSDGFYAITVNSSSGLNPNNSSNGPYSYKQNAIVNIKPSDSPGNNLIYAATNGGTYTLQTDSDGADKLTRQLNVNGDFTLDLNGYTLTIEIPSGGDNGIKIASGKTFTIKDSRSGGVLNVSNKEDYYVYPIWGSAGINTTDGTLIIEGGKVNATGGRGAAGIGGGYGASGGNVTINGGTVNATGGYNGGAGIGGGAGGTASGVAYDGGTGGIITINGGMITAIGGYSEEYSNSGAGIGGGNNGGTGGTITINGGIVTATARGNYGAGIGGGRLGAGGNIAINGGMVTATGGSRSTGIGDGYNGIGGTLAMNGNALVFANSVGDASAKTSGILVIGNTTNWYGSDITLSPIQYTIPSSRTLTIPNGKTLKIPGYATLTIPSGTTIANNGTVIPENNSTIAISGTRSGNLIVGANVSEPALASEATLLANTGQSVEYAISTTAAEPASGWQAGAAFANLNEEIEYYIFARSKADTNFTAGTPTMQIVNIRRIPKATDLTYAMPTDHIYNGTARGIGNVTGTGMGAITVLYNNSTSIPIKAGTYKVTVNVTGGNDFYAAMGIVLGNYEIKAKPVTITGVSANSKEYDGNATATVSGTATVNGVIDGDDVTIINGTASFADKDAGTGKLVTFSGFWLAGADMDNYVLTAQPASVTADITSPLSPILSQIATGNRLMTPTRNGVNLAAKTNATIAVYNLNGKLVSQQNYNAGNHSISFGHLSKGVYVVRASHGSESQVLRVVVSRH